MMKPILALISIFIASPFASAANTYAKTLTCEARTQDSKVETTFSQTLSIVEFPKGSGHQFYTYRSPEAFKTSDGLYVVGLSGDQPLNGPEISHDRISIWVTDAINGGDTVQSGGSLFSDVDQDYASLSIINRQEKNVVSKMLIQCWLK